jgi:hypothetical protein
VSWTFEELLDQMGAWPIDEQTDNDPQMKYLAVIEVDGAGHEAFWFPFAVEVDHASKLVVIKAKR